MALLRESSRAVGSDADLRGALGEGAGGIANGNLMLAFAEAATRGEDALPGVRDELLAAIGPARFVEVAATVGIFNGLVRVADSTGIPLDGGMVRASEAFRRDLGLDAFGGAGNTDLAGGSGAAGDSVRSLFGD